MKFGMRRGRAWAPQFELCRKYWPQKLSLFMLAIANFILESAWTSVAMMFCNCREAIVAY